MDTLLLAEIVKDCLGKGREVTLPGFGIFRSETVPAYFSDKGYTLNPPYRKIVFAMDRNAVAGEGDAFVEEYSRANGKDAKTARSIISVFSKSLCDQVMSSRDVYLEGLGHLKATKGGLVFFVADEGVGASGAFDHLSSISLKTRTAAPSPAEPAAVDPQPQPQELCPAAKDQDTRAGRRASRFAVIMGVLLAIAAAGLCALAILGRMAPDVVDRILYSEEELEIINAVLR